MSSFVTGLPPSVYPPILSEGVDASLNESRWNAYREVYAQSISDPAKFWKEMAHEYLSWSSTFDTVMSGGFEKGDLNWFHNGKINVCYNCVDRHLAKNGDKSAIIWEGDEIGTTRSISYNELSHRVCNIANVLRLKGVKKGDVVTIYMPMIPEVAMVMLACARIGAVHSIVFAGFSADSLRDRILDCHSKFLVVADEGKRGGKVLGLKSIADHAAIQCPNLDTMFVFQYTGNPKVTMHESRDVWMHDLLPLVPNTIESCPCEEMNSEDTFFILYTSGSTGKPKGVAHTTAGYILYAAMTTHRSFDIKVSS